MDEYAVKLTPRALRDLDEIYAYIADTLLERGTAGALVERLEKGILSLGSDKRVKKNKNTRNHTVSGVFHGKETIYG